MAAIDVGSAAENRNAYTIAGRTFIDYNNPADGNGAITEAQFYVYAQCDSLEVGIFIDEGGNTFSTRDGQAVPGVYAAGYHEVVVDLDVQTGDYIGQYESTGAIDRESSGGGGVYFALGDKIPCASASFILYTDDVLSLYGIGATTGGGSARGWCQK